MPDGEQIPGNMRIWNTVEKTDPKYTKPVDRGGSSRKFTTIAAQYTVQKATQLFGPVGDGWGYEASYPTLLHDLPDTDRRPGGRILVQFADVVVWYNVEGKRCQYGPVRGCNLLATASGHIDDDAPKKALTDALTKALSHLGFSADVFMGMYDDNKYVADLRREFTARKTAPDDIIPGPIRSCIEAMRKLTTIEAVNDHSRANGELFNAEPGPVRDWIKLQYQSHREGIRRRQMEEA